MTISKQLQATLDSFQLGNPHAEWPELAEKLKERAETILQMSVERHELDITAWVHDDQLSPLDDVAGMASLSEPQARAVNMAARVMRAAQRRFSSASTKELLAIIEELKAEVLTRGAPEVPEEQKQVVTAEGKQVFFSFLAKLYLAEQKGNVKDSSWDDIRHTCNALAAALTSSGAELNLWDHTREDMVNLKSTLLETRKPSTVNKMLTRFSTVMTWAVNNNYLQRSFDKGLKIAKGADSARKAFTQEQVVALMDHANALDPKSWDRWAMSLGVLTGARIGEIHQLAKADIYQIDGLTVLDINEDGADKSIKNKHSKRLVPPTSPRLQ